MELGLNKSIHPSNAIFTQWCQKELFNSDLITGTNLLQQALDLHLLNLYARLDLDNLLKNPATPRALSAILNYSDSSYIALEAILERLNERFSFLKKTTGAGETTFRRINNPEEPNISLDKIRAQMLALGQDFVTTLDFLQYGEDKFEHSLRDDPDFMDRVLTGREPGQEKIWFEATNVDPLQDVHGIMGAVAIDAPARVR